MSGPVRVAGSGSDSAGARVTWTVSEGRRGRRWREVLTDDGRVRHALLLETGLDRRFNHLELAAAGGLWTFHPEPDGTLHGNVVVPGSAGIRHVDGWPFGAAAILLIEGSTLAAAAIVWHASTGQAAGTTVAVPGVIWRRPDGELEPGVGIELERVSETRWRIGDGPAFEVDVDGLPILADGARHALEVG